MPIDNPPAFLQAGTYTASRDRLNLISTRFIGNNTASNIACRSGFLPGQSNRRANFNMTTWDVTIGPFIAVIENTFAVNGGDYQVFNGNNQVLAVTPSAPTTNRIDIIGVRVQDAFYAGALNQADIVVVQGTATAGVPADPVLPSSFIPIVRVTVNAASTSGVLTSLRKATALAGAVYQPYTEQLTDSGIIVGEIQQMPAAGVYPARLRVWDGTVWKGVSSFAFDQPAQVGSGTLNVATDLTMKSLSVADPGYAYRVVGGGAIDWGVIAASSPLQLMVASITVDSTGWNVGQISAGFQVSHSAGGSGTQPTAIATPGNSASFTGAHTVRLIARNGGGTNFTVPVSALTRLNVTLVPA